VVEYLELVHMHKGEVVALKSSGSWGVGPYVARSDG
jgi:hypothetical protein